MDRPAALLRSDMDFTKLMLVSEEYLDAVEASKSNGGWLDEDIAHYMMEEALKAIYGPDVFKWINARV